VVHVQHETPQARTDFKGREHDLIDRDRHEASERDGERMVMKERDAEQRESE